MRRNESLSSEIAETLGPKVEAPRPPGQHVLRVHSEQEWFNLNALRITSP